MLNFLKKITLTSCLLACSLSANASLITNGSFELLNFADNSTTRGIVFNTELQQYTNKNSAWDVFSVLPGWTTSSGTGIELQKNVVTKSQDGQQHIELDSSRRNGSNSAMTQTLDSLTIGNQYLLEFYYKPRTNQQNDNGINVFWYDAALGFNQDLTAIYTANSTRRQTKDWALQSIAFTAQTESMNLTFGAFGKQNTLGGLIDNVSLNQVTSVPEPTALMLFLPALALLIRRKKQQK